MADTGTPADAGRESAPTEPVAPFSLLPVDDEPTILNALLRMLRGALPEDQGLARIFGNRG